MSRARDATTRASRLSVRRSLACVLLLSLGACQYLQFLPLLKRPVDPSARGWSETKRYGDGDGSMSRIEPSTDWPLYNGSYDGLRHSPLAQITSANVARLVVVCRVPLEKHAVMQSGPVVIRGIAYVTTAVNTWAIDATTCRTRWRHTYRYEPKPDWDLKVNRGVAYAETPDGPVLVRGANDGRIYALDARTGEERWNVLAGDAKKGETFPAAPIAWRGLVYIGNAGGDNYGVTGRMMAFDARSGRRVWSFDLVPGTGPANETWPAMSDSVPRAGGTTWTSYTLDTLSGLLYVPTGNAAPDFLSAVREGANQHTYSVVVLDARTGELRRAHQLLNGDFHDWDVAAAPLLVRTKGGRSLVAVAGKDGHLYGLEGEQGTRRFTTAVTTIENADVPLTRGGTRFCPGVQGGVEWNGPSFDAETNMLIVGAVTGARR